MRGQRPEEIECVGSAESLLVRSGCSLPPNLREVLENVTVADVAARKLPGPMLTLTREEEAWQTR